VYKKDRSPVIIGERFVFTAPGVEGTTIMAWDRVLTELPDLFVGLYPTVADAIGVVRRVGLPQQFINFSGSALNYWGETLEQARLRKKLDHLIEVAQKDFPNIDFPAIAGRATEPAPPAPKLDSRSWKGTLATSGL
jgi:hypothetical protein